LPVPPTPAQQPRPPTLPCPLIRHPQHTKDPITNPNQPRHHSNTSFFWVVGNTRCGFMIWFTQVLGIDISGCHIQVNCHIVPTLTTHYLFAPPLVLRDVGIDNHAPLTMPHHLHATSTLVTSTTRHTCRPCHANHTPHTKLTTTCQHPPCYLNAAMSTAATSTAPPQ